MDLLLNGVGDLVIRGVEKTEEFHAFFTLVFTSKACLQELQVSEANGTIWSKEGLLSVVEGRIRFESAYRNWLWALMEYTCECRQS